MGPRAGLERRGKSHPPPPQSGFDPRNVQPVASHYYDWAMLAHAWRHCRVLICKVATRCSEKAIFAFKGVNEFLFVLSTFGTILCEIRCSRCALNAIGRL